MLQAVTALHYSIYMTVAHIIRLYSLWHKLYAYTSFPHQNIMSFKIFDEKNLATRTRSCWNSIVLKYFMRITMRQ